MTVQELNHISDTTRAFVETARNACWQAKWRLEQDLIQVTARISELSEALGENPDGSKKA